MTIKLISAGWKQGPPPKADLYLDCRGIPNPFHEKSLSGTGDDEAVQKWVGKKGVSHITDFLCLLADSIPQIPGRRQDEADPFARPYVVACMCAHGIHRSRAVKHILKKRIEAGDLDELTAVPFQPAALPINVEVE